MSLRVSLGYMSSPLRQYVRPPRVALNASVLGMWHQPAEEIKGVGSVEEFVNLNYAKVRMVNVVVVEETTCPLFRGCQHHVRAAEIEKVRTEGENIIC